MIKFEGSEKQIKWANDILSPLMVVLKRHVEINVSDSSDPEKMENSIGSLKRIIESIEQDGGDVEYIIRERHSFEIDEFGRLGRGFTFYLSETAKARGIRNILNRAIKAINEMQYEENSAKYDS